MWTHNKHIIHGPGDLWFGITCCRTHDGDLRSTCKWLILGHNSDFRRFCKGNTQSEMSMMLADLQASHCHTFTFKKLFVYLFYTFKTVQNWGLLLPAPQSSSSPWKTEAGCGWAPKAWLCTPQAQAGPQRVSSLAIHPKALQPSPALSAHLEPQACSYSWILEAWQWARLCLQSLVRVWHTLLWGDIRGLGLRPMTERGFHFLGPECKGERSRTMAYYYTAARAGVPLSIL